MAAAAMAAAAASGGSSGGDRRQRAAAAPAAASAGRRRRRARRQTRRRQRRQRRRRRRAGGESGSRAGLDSRATRGAADREADVLKAMRRASARDRGAGAGGRHPERSARCSSSGTSSPACIGLRRAPMAWETRELIEIGAAVGLVLGVVLGALLLARTLLRNRAVESRLRQVSGAFAELLEERFAPWGLTRSERDVAWFTIKGLSIAEIARLRGTSEGTVKAHSNAIYRKAGVSGRTQLLSLFIEDLMEGAPPPTRPRRESPRDRRATAACPERPRRRKPRALSRGRRFRPGAPAAGAERGHVTLWKSWRSGTSWSSRRDRCAWRSRPSTATQVACVWCHEGEIGRDAFDARLLKKWEFREEERPARAEGGAQAVPRRPRGRRQAVPPRRRATSGRAASPAGTASRARRSSSARTAESGWVAALCGCREPRASAARLRSSRASGPRRRGSRRGQGPRLAARPERQGQRGARLGAVAFHPEPGERRLGAGGGARRLEVGPGTRAAPPAADTAR